MDLKITKSISYFFNSLARPVKFVLFLCLLLSVSCSNSPDNKEETSREDKPEIVVRKRADGTISSVNQVDENNRVHGIRATYYGDGSTLYSKHTFSHGRKQGPAIWYYMNGQVYKESHFEQGKRQGLTRIYYKNGQLSGEYDSHEGNVLPGLKEYLEDGTLITSYPEIEFRENNLLDSKNRVDLQVFCTKKRSGVKFYVLNQAHGETSRVYLITENDSALLQYYVQPGKTLDKKVEILAEIPTELGNVLAREYSYDLKISN
jgi:hypothetical protein